MSLSIDAAGGITELMLDRPDKRNAIDGELMRSLSEAAAAVRADPSCRVVLLHGAGRSFCAGLDMANLAAMAGGELDGDTDSVREALAERSAQGANRAQQVGWVWREVEVPVIAAVHGHALGGGLNLALGADLRIVAPDTSLGFVEITFGLFPDMSGTQTLRRLVGPDRAKELVMTGRRVSGEEAVRIGLATEAAADPLARARDLARQIAGRSPEAVRAIKAVLDETPEMTRADGLAMEAERSREL
ncbi:MAG: crotonase/enoyl-CoA hydratase family protein, partial [Actinomycetota bacterium]